MDDLIHQLSTILRGVWQRRWIGIGVAWLVGVIGAVVVLLTPDRFEASARIAVDTQSLLRPLMQGMTVEPNIDQQLAMLSRTLISRPNVEKLIQMAGLDRQVQGGEGRSGQRRHAAPRDQDRGPRQSVYPELP